jgi:hypothetical protein
VALVHNPLAEQCPYFGGRQIAWGLLLVFTVVGDLGLTPVAKIEIPSSCSCRDDGYKGQQE